MTPWTPLRNPYIPSLREKFVHAASENRPAVDRAMGEGLCPGAAPSLLSADPTPSAEPLALIPTQRNPESTPVCADRIPTSIPSRHLWDSSQGELSVHSSDFCSLDTFDLHTTHWSP